MNKRIIARVLEEGKYILDNDKTVREMAGIFGISKSTIHKDLRERLFLIDKDMYSKVSNVLHYHMDIRHIRGGESTKRKFLEKNANY